MVRWIFAWLGTAGVFAALDAVWLISTNQTLYRPVLGPILLAGVRPVPALLFYLIYLTGTVVMAVRPGLKSGKWFEATAMGALFGFFAYATYDLTNEATLAIWPSKITLIDLSWGTVLTATAATAGYFAGARVQRA